MKLLLLIAMLAIVSELVLVPDITVAEQAALPMLAVLKGWLMAFTWTVVELVVTAMGLLPTATVMACCSHHHLSLSAAAAVATVAVVAVAAPMNSHY